MKRISDLTEVQFVEEFMQTGQHVIVKDGMRDWPESMTSVTIVKIKEVSLVYQKETKAAVWPSTISKKLNALQAIKGPVITNVKQLKRE